MYTLHHEGNQRAAPSSPRAPGDVVMGTEEPGGSAGEEGALSSNAPSSHLPGSRAAAKTPPAQPALSAGPGVIANTPQSHALAREVQDTQTGMFSAGLPCEGTKASTGARSPRRSVKVTRKGDWQNHMCH